MVLALAIPVYFIFPAAADVLLLVSLPPHAYMTMTHVFHDYLPDSVRYLSDSPFLAHLSQISGRIVPPIIAALIFLGIARMLFSGEGFVHGTLGAIWAEE